MKDTLNDHRHVRLS
jgi:hypothetical protein